MNINYKIIALNRIDLDHSNWVKDQQLTGHDASVNSVAISTDVTIISGSSDETIKVWDPSGKCLKTLSGHNSAVKSVDISPDGKTIVSGSYNNVVKVWNTDTGHCLKTVKGEGKQTQDFLPVWVLSVSFSPDGKKIVWISNDGRIHVMDTDEDYKYTRKICKEGCRALAINPSSESFIVATNTNRFVVYDMDLNCINNNLAGATSKLNEQLSGGRHHNAHQNRINIMRSLAMSPDGECIATGSDDPNVKVWSINNDECIKVLEGHERGITSVAFTQDGQYIPSCVTYLKN